MNKFYKILEWDSAFFEFPVCRIEKMPTDDHDLSIFLNHVHKDKIELAYFFSKNILEAECSLSHEFKIKKVDTKVTYFKPVTAHAYINDKIQTYPSQSPNKQLIALAIESGAYSRFKVDDSIPTNKFEKLYELWITNSVERKIAKEVLIYSIDKEIDGFITIAGSHNYSQIGLVAVSADRRGMGIGTALDRAVETWSAANGFQSIQVVTQEDNELGCLFYERCGYHVISREHVYHLWKK